MELLR